jgi:hypothetical protein
MVLNSLSTGKTSPFYLYGYYPIIYLQGMSKTKKYLGQDSNWSLPKYKSTAVLLSSSHKNALLSMYVRLLTAKFKWKISQYCTLQLCLSWHEKLSPAIMFET